MLLPAFSPLDPAITRSGAIANRVCLKDSPIGVAPRDRFAGRLSDGISNDKPLFTRNGFALISILADFRPLADADKTIFLAFVVERIKTRLIPFSTGSDLFRMKLS